MNQPNRKKNRLSSWDYSATAVYFVTFCTCGRKPLLGKIIYRETGASADAFLEPSEIGTICIEEIRSFDERENNCDVLAFAVMPNHVHLLLEIYGRGNPAEKKGGLSAIVSRIKQRVTHRVHATVPDLAVWQRSFHDHIVRGESDFIRIFEYIENNPAKWALDKYHVD